MTPDDFEPPKPLSKEETINAVLDAVIVCLCFLWLVSVLVRIQ